MLAQVLAVIVCPSDRHTMTANTRASIVKIKEITVHALKIERYNNHHHHLIR